MGWGKNNQMERIKDTGQFMKIHDKMLVDYIKRKDKLKEKVSRKDFKEITKKELLKYAKTKRRKK